MPEAETPEEKKPKWDSYEIHSIRMAQQIQHVTDELQLNNIVPVNNRYGANDGANDDDDDSHQPISYPFLQRRLFTIQDPITDAYLATLNIGAFITDERMAQIIEHVQQEGYFDANHPHSAFVIYEINARCEDLMDEERYKHTEEYLQKMRRKEEEEKLAYETRIRQPDSLLNLSARVGPKTINDAIRRDDDKAFERYLDVLDRTNRVPRPENLVARMAYHDSIKCFRLIIDRMNNWNIHAYDDALLQRPGAGMVTSFWQLTSVIVLTWGAARIRTYMRSMLLYQPGNFGFATGPITAKLLKLQKRHGISVNNSATFLSMRESCVITNHTKESKGFGNLETVPKEKYERWHWN